MPQKEQQKYFLHGNCYDTWEVSIRNYGRMEVIKRFSASDKIAELNKNPDLGIDKKRCRQSVFYLQERIAAENFIKALNDD